MTLPTPEPEAATEPAPPTSALDVDQLLELTVNPADRLWRYPICNAVVKCVAKTPITPNHITVAHTLFALGAGVVITYGTPRAFVLAGVMFELRSILDCLDGVLARATKKSSPFGRALDQLGDTIGFLSLMAGGLVCLGRTYGWATAILVVTLTMPISGSCSSAWDFYRRRFASLLRDGYDTTQEEYLQLCHRLAAKPMLSLWVSKTIALWGWYTLSPRSLPYLRDRIARRDWPQEGVKPEVTPAARALREAAGRNDPELRSMLTRLAIVAGDNIILLMTISLLLGHYLVVFPVVMAWGIIIWLYTVVSLNRYFGAATAAALQSQSHRTPA